MAQRGASEQCLEEHFVLLFAGDHLVELLGVALCFEGLLEALEQLHLLGCCVFDLVCELLLDLVVGVLLVGFWQDHVVVAGCGF